MSDDRINLSRRTVLAGLGTIGAAGAAAGLGTSAYFNDQESFENNTLTAGSLDLRVDWEEHYWNGFALDDIDLVQVDDPDGVPEGYTALPDPENPMVAVDDLAAFMDATTLEAYPDSNDDGVQDNLEHYDACQHFAQLDRDLDPVEGGYQVSNDGVRMAKRTNNDDTMIEDGAPAPLVNLDDVKPGDFGELTLSFHLCDNPGYVWLQGALDEANTSENGLTEPESQSQNEESGTVELLDEIQTMAWYDEDGDNVYEPGGESNGEADIVLVLDRSGSMSGSKNTEMRAAAKNLVDALNLGANAAQVGIVSFADQERLDHALSTNASTVKTAIDGVGDSGSTNLEGGVNGAEDELTGSNHSQEVTASGNHRSGADKVIVVLSDGAPNVDDNQVTTGDTNESPTEEATRAKNNGVEIYTVGFGISSGGSTAQTLEDMASSPKNTHAYLGQVGDLTQIFGQISQQIAGEEVFFRGTLRELLSAAAGGSGIPLDGDRSTGYDETGDPDADSARDPFVNSTNNFVGLAWWLPRSVGNHVQSDTIAFDLGFRVEQSRHNDGSGMT
ncbi:vWA domain-containing protein [Halobacteriales archaeon Cl-PHB]